MFKFEPIERCLYGGGSPNLISNAVRNEFLMFFGEESLDFRVSVVLSKRNIQFFYYDEPNDKDILQNARSYDLLEEIGSISLSLPKETGSDILNFPQNGFLPKEIKDNNELIVTIEKLMGDEKIGFRKLFSHFPFIDNYNGDVNGKQEKNIRVFNCFVKCCLLAFVFEFEDRGENFANSPLYDEVRTSLRKSEVYNLLSAKLQYALYTTQNGLVYNPDEYSYKVQKVADRLMDRDFNMFIQPDNFIENKKEERQGWFYNPEKELELILKKNRVQKKNKAAVLKDNLVLKIQSFMYSRHAIGKAKTLCWSKALFKIAQVFMLVGNIIMVSSAIGFKNDFWNCFYNNYGLVFLMLIVAVILIISSGWGNRNWANALLPRILVAEAAAWLTIGIAEDLVKSMLWIDKNLFLYFLIVLGVVSLLVYGESKQHSPYLCWNNNMGKTLLIMNHSLYFALSFGCAMQLFFYNNLLKNSDALTTVVYNNHFDQAEKYLQQLENLDNSINDYTLFSREYVFSNARHRGTNRSRNNIGGIIVFQNRDTARITLENMISLNTDLISSLGDDIVEYHKQLLRNIKNNVDSINNNIDSIIKSVIKNDSNPLKYKVEFGRCIEKCGMKDMAEKADTATIRSNIIWIWGIMPNLKKEIQDVRNHLMNDDFNTLIEWATYRSPSENTNNSSEKDYLGLLIQSAQEKKCCRRIDVPLLGENRFFPNLLLVHTLIVLILAFITQLIISEKSVTEPL